MKTLNFFTLTSIQTGIYICVSAIMGGHVLFTKFGFRGAIIGLALGSLILWGIGIIFARLALVRRKTLIGLVQDYFGAVGAKICGIAFSISLIGWFGLQLEMMSQGVNLIFPDIPVILISLFFGFLITLSVWRGMRWMGKLANWSVPFLIIMMVCMLIQAYDPSIAIPDSSWTYDGLLGGLSLTIALSIAGVIDTPTYFCVSRSEKDAYIAITIVYLLILPLIALIGLLLAIYTQSDDFVKMIMGFEGTESSASSLWQLFILCFLILAGWTTNNGNLYSASIALEPFLIFSYNLRTWFLGTMGSLLACLGVLENFSSTLSAMSIAIGSIGAALMGRFLWNKLKYIPIDLIVQKNYVLIIIIGTCIGFIGHMQFIVISGFGFMDAFLVTIFLVCFYEGGQKWLRKSI